MKPLVNPALGEAWAVHEALRRLGFRPDDIFFQIGGEVAPGDYQICVVLRAQGKEFTAIPMTMKEDPERIETLWSAFIRDFIAGNIPEAEMERIWKRSQARTNGAALVATLLAKGFVFPNSIELVLS